MGIRSLVPCGLKQSVTNALGWNTDQKIVVFESDDWGSIRMPSRHAWESLHRQGVNVDDPYNRLDSLETGVDLSALCEVLTSFKDGNGRSPVFTANFLVANPDFVKIKKDCFENYHYELLPETYRNTPGCEGSWNVLQEGVEAGVLRPQLHGREHLNVPLWMSALREGHHDTMLAFDQGCWGHVTNYKDAKCGWFLAAFDYNSEQESRQVRETAIEGARLFAQAFGYRSETFIASNYIWGPSIESALAGEGVIAFQGQRNQLIPVIDALRCRRRFHYTGQRNPSGQRYMVRNAFFEPSAEPCRDWVNSCLKEIAKAFAWRTPAIISTHRVNFIGSLNHDNRERNLDLLHQLLDGVVQRWPDTEFMSSDQLANLMRARA